MIRAKHADGAPRRRYVPSSFRRALIATLALLPVPWSNDAEAAKGLRWVGDARVAADAEGSVLGGPTLRFRYGKEFRRRPRIQHLGEEPPPDNGVLDFTVGSWVGFEVSSGLLVGSIESGRLGVVVLVGGRPWLSRRQESWFLRTERFSLLGLLLPEAGAAFGLAGGPDWYLGWDLPLGTEEFQIVPAMLWISPGSPAHVYGTLAFRVPM